MKAEGTKGGAGKSLEEVIAEIEARHPEFKSNVPSPESDASATKKVRHGAEIADFVHRKKLGEDY